MSVLKFSLAFLLVLSYTRISRGIILCDNACGDASEPLAICDKARVLGRTPLNIMGFFPCNVQDFRARALTVAGQMAALAVRSGGSILQNYSLELAFENTMVSSAYSYN